MNRPSIVRCLTVLVAMALCGCGVDEPSSGQGYDPYNPYPGQYPNDPNGQNPTDPTQPQGVMLTVDPMASTTVCHDTVMIRGSATAGADVIAKGGAGPATRPATTGRFCIDVPLRRSQANELEIRAQHPEHGLSDPRLITIVHDPAACAASQPQPTPTESMPVNVAEGATVTSLDPPHENAASNIVDGDLATWTTWKGGDWYVPWGSYKGWIKIELANITEVEQVIVHWRDRKNVGPQEFGAVYQLLYAPGPGLGEPNPGTWLTPPDGRVTAGDGGADPFVINGPVKAVAIWLEKNGQTGWFESFAIAEVEVLRRPETHTGVTGYGSGYTCETVGSGP